MRTGQSQMAIITDIDPGGPNNELPSVPGPVDPGYGVELPPVVDNGLPDHPSVWPPQRPNYPVDPDYGVPTVPGVWPNPPGLVGGGHPDHPIQPVPIYPSHPIYRPPNEPSHPITLPPGAVWPPLPPAVGDAPLIALVWIVGIGYRWAVLNASVELPIYEPPSRPDQGLPPSAQPKKGP